MARSGAAVADGAESVKSAAVAATPDVADAPAPITAPRGASPALASQPAGELDHTFHAYEENPAPWWLGLVWIGFLLGGATYLIVNLAR